MKSGTIVAFEAVICLDSICGMGCFPILPRTEFIRASALTGRVAAMNSIDSGTIIAAMPTAKKVPIEPLRNTERHKRFVKMAREMNVGEYLKDSDKAFKKVVKKAVKAAAPAKTTKKN